MKLDIVIVHLLLDAFRFDYLDEETTPFLFNLLNDGNTSYSKLDTGFSFRIDAVFFTGTSPQVNNCWTLFQYDPTNTPFNWFRTFGGLIQRFPKQDFLHMIMNRLLRHGWWKRKHGVFGTTAMIPFNLLANFSYSSFDPIFSPNSFDNVSTIFDILRTRGEDFVFNAYPIYYSDSLITKVTCEIKPPLPRYLFIHLSALDNGGHVWGPHTPQFKILLKKLDTQVQQIYQELQKKADNLVFILFSDHGMDPVDHAINVESYLPSKLQRGRDYLPFYDSTLARFWFFNSTARNTIMDSLSGNEELILLDEKTKKRLGINFKHNRYGDEIYVVPKGSMILPNYFQTKEMVKGMHGYAPLDQPNNTGIIAIHSKENRYKLKSNPKIGGIFPTTLDLLNYEIPPSCEYNSLI